MLNSLQSKLTLGYLIVAVLTLGLSLYTFEGIRVAQQRMLLGERTSELFDAAMEIRRFERNYFLHGQEADQRENALYIDKLQELLLRDQADFSLLGVPERIGTLRADLDNYRNLMQAYARTGDQEKRDLLEPRIRSAGQVIVAVAEKAVISERHLVRSYLDSFRTTLVFSFIALALLIIASGQALSRLVVRPLKQMERSVEAVQHGRRDKLQMPSRDREMVAVVNAFNQMLKELELRQKHLMRSEKLASLGTMLSGVAHELNNPLSNIWSSCQILLEELGEADPDSQRRLLNQIDEQSERARNIVRSLLDFARDRKFNRETLPLGQLMAQTLQFLKGQVPPKVKVTVDIPDDITLFADKQRLQQVFLNLIKNAVEAVGESGEVTISAHRIDTNLEAMQEQAAPVGCQVEGGAIDISVRDSGPGIAADLLPRIFDPFFTTKDVGRGMGLGLFIVYQIVDEHGGCIFAKSEPGQGADFHVRLPLQGS